jgi:hypothetical protein
MLFRPLQRRHLRVIRAFVSMSSYRLSPYAEFVENRLFPQTIQYGIFHRLTGEVVVVSEPLRNLLLTYCSDRELQIDDEALKREQGNELSDLIDADLLVTGSDKALDTFLDYYVIKPIQNPAVSYRSQSDETVVVRTSMRQRLFAPAAHHAPEVIEEVLPPVAAALFSLADGTRTLKQAWSVAIGSAELDVDDKLFNETLNYLTDKERQLVKLVPPNQDLTDPFAPFNLVPRDLCVATSHPETVTDFHQYGIEDALWEFDWIEPTVNHGLRFPTPVLGGLSYGARFYEATIEELSISSGKIEMLEVGGGTGSFARSFLDHAAGNVEIRYSLVDLSQTLFAAQQRALGNYLSQDKHFLQNATDLDLPGRRFDLIIANEVIADFPVASVARAKDEHGEVWTGSGAESVVRFSLVEENSPAAFLINQGVFEFIERIWDHLVPGGAAILTEYGGLDLYPARTHHLNHDEYSIHFGHLAKCARSIGFSCRILSLKDFLSLDDCVEVLAGQEEHILCLNHVLNRHEVSLPFAILSRTDFAERVGSIPKQIELSGHSFTPLSNSFHYGPTLDQFFVAIMKKPVSE